MPLSTNLNIIKHNKIKIQLKILGELFT